MQAMELTLNHEDGVMIARVQGIIDESSREVFRERVHPQLSQRGARLVVDLSGADRANSVGLASLVMLTTQANTVSSRVVFCSPPPYIRGVLAATKLDSFLEVAPSLEDAILRLTSDGRK